MSDITFGRAAADVPDDRRREALAAIEDNRNLTAGDDE